jgi:magnesium-transporting ATPase (P-type)
VTGQPPLSWADHRDDLRFLMIRRVSRSTGSSILSPETNVQDQHQWPIGNPNPDTGLTHVEVDTLRKEHGYNEVAEKKGHTVLKFLGKFWGNSAWMLELIMVLSAVLKNYLDFAVVGALLVINAVLSRLIRRSSYRPAVYANTCI